MSATRRKKERSADWTEKRQAQPTTREVVRRILKEHGTWMRWTDLHWATNCSVYLSAVLKSMVKSGEVEVMTRGDREVEGSHRGQRGGGLRLYRWAGGDDLTVDDLDGR